MEHHFFLNPPPRFCEVGVQKRGGVPEPPLYMCVPFYLAVIDNPKTEVWYKKQRLGVNSMDHMMRNIIKNTPLKTSTMGDKSVETLGNKIDFRASWTQFSLSPPKKTMLIFLFL